jgi:hypothetical protein
MKQKTWMGMIGLLLLSLTGCDTDAGRNDSLEGYYSLTAEFVSPSDIGNDYVILFNSDTIKYARRYPVGRTNPTGILRVFEKGNREPVYTEELRLTSDINIQFIKLGDKIDTYSADKYTTFTLDIKWATREDQDRYEATFNGFVLNARQFDNTNYVLKEALTGRLRLKKIDDGEIVLDKEVTIEPNGTVTFLQLSSIDFVVVPPGDEEDPVSDDYKKVRVYYTLTDELTEESYTIKFYTFDAWLWDEEQTVDIGYEFEIKAGELSPYITVYGRTFENEAGDGGVVSLAYDLIAKDGTVVRKPLNARMDFFDMDWSGDYYKFLNKFETYSINHPYGGTLVLEERW